MPHIPDRSPVTYGRVLRTERIADLVFTEAIHAPDTRLSNHTHDQAAITFVTSGEFVEELDGVPHRCVAFSLLFKPAGLPHRNEYSPGGAHSLIVELAPDAVRALLPYADFERYATHSARGVPAALAFRLYRAFAGGRDALEIDAEELLLELLTSASQRCRCDRTTLPTWLRRTQARLHDEYGRPLSLSMLAADAGVHPVYLARAFRRRFGCSIGDYLHGRRLDAAVERLIAGGQGVLELGLDVGFYDQSHFTRRFKRAVGLPPGAFRALARQTTRS